MNWATIRAKSQPKAKDSWLDCRIVAQKPSPCFEAHAYTVSSPCLIPACRCTFSSTSLRGAATAEQPPVKLASVSAKGDNSEHLVDYPKIGVDIGNGWNSLTDKSPARSGVLFFEQKTDNGQDTREDLTSITDQSTR